MIKEILGILILQWGSLSVMQITKKKWSFTANPENIYLIILYNSSFCFNFMLFILVHHSKGRKVNQINKKELNKVDNWNLI